MAALAAGCEDLKEQLGVRRHWQTPPVHIAFARVREDHRGYLKILLWTLARIRLRPNVNDPDAVAGTMVFGGTLANGAARWFEAPGSELNFIAMKGS